MTGDRLLRLDTQSFAGLLDGLVVSTREQEVVAQVLLLHIPAQVREWQHRQPYRRGPHSRPPTTPTITDSASSSAAVNSTQRRRDSS